MSLIVETGAVVAGANSYESLSDANAYFTDRPGGAWASATDAQKTGALLAATAFIDRRYEWIGSQSSRERERLSWPRTGAVTTEGVDHSGTIPRELRWAVCELAQAHLGESLSAPRESGEVASVSIGPVSESYFQGAGAGRSFPFVEGMLRTLHRGRRGGTVRRMRRF